MLKRTFPAEVVGARLQGDGFFFVMGDGQAADARPGPTAGGKAEPVDLQGEWRVRAPTSPARRLRPGG